jgi:hypothetical protein
MQNYIYQQSEESKNIESHFANLRNRLPPPNEGDQAQVTVYLRELYSILEDAYLLADMRAPIVTPAQQKVCFEKILTMQSQLYDAIHKFNQHKG